MKFNADQVHTIKCALLVAADEYSRCAADCRESPRLVQQFKRQAADARALADAIEGDLSLAAVL